MSDKYQNWEVLCPFPIGMILQMCCCRKVDDDIDGQAEETYIKFDSGIPMKCNTIQTEKYVESSAPEDEQNHNIDKTSDEYGSISSHPSIGSNKSKVSNLQELYYSLSAEERAKRVNGRICLELFFGVFFLLFFSFTNVTSTIGFVKTAELCYSAFLHIVSLIK